VVRYFGTQIQLPADPAMPMQAATRNYVDTAVAALSSGALIDGGTPSTSPSGVLKIDFGAVT
jgi:phage-related tail fiber protein